VEDFSRIDTWVQVDMGVGRVEDFSTIDTWVQVDMGVGASEMDAGFTDERGAGSGHRSSGVGSGRAP
jgi:hypothetical protein